MVKIKPKTALAILSLAATVLMFLLFLPEKRKNSSIVKLNASVKFDGSKFVVSNNDTLDYLDAELTLNGYYKIQHLNLMMGETYTLWPVEFSHINGNRMPEKQKPLQFAIWCRLADERNGYYSVEFTGK